MSLVSRVSFSLLSLFLLICGFIIYTCCRPTDFVYIISGFDVECIFPPISFPSCPLIFGSIPSFLHVFCFGILTVVLLPKQNSQVVIWVGMFWVAVNFFFELGQVYNGGCEMNMMSGIFILENLCSYFSDGVFDVWDLFFSYLGGVSFVFLLLSDLEGSCES